MGGFPVFVVYGPDHVAHIRHTLLPALAAQTLDQPITVHAVNYAASLPLLKDLEIGPAKIRDWSGEKPAQRFGFGEAMNYLFSKAEPPDYFLLLNPDTIPDRAALGRLRERFDPRRTGQVEARQWPSEHPKEYDLTTGRTPWASGACTLVNSAMFDAAGGFDPIYFMYCEDVDLSWQSWLQDKEVIYAPEAGVMHFTGLLHYRHDRYYLEHFYSARNFLVIARKFFGDAGEKKASDLLSGSSYTLRFIEQVIHSYGQIRHSIREVQHLPHPMIKITGFNTYHTMQHSPASMPQRNIFNALWERIGVRAKLSEVAHG